MNWRKVRLLKLASHLEKGNLFVDKFDYGVVFAIDRKGGSCGCAIAETAVVFPEYWELEGPLASCNLTFKGRAGTNTGLSKFFGLGYKQVSYLFYPQNGMETYFTAKQVANKIKKFCKTKWPTKVP